jgi:hypothetical protein
MKSKAFFFTAIMISLLLTSPSFSQDAIDAVGDGVSPGGFKLEELGTTAAEFILNIQNLGFVKASVQIIKKSNIDLLATYQTMKKIKEGEFKLHEEFRENVLNIVKDEVRNHSKILQTFEMLAAIRKEAKAARGHIDALDVFTAAEKEFFTESYSNILQEALFIAAEVATITTDKELAMNDAERIRLVYILHDSTFEMLSDLRNFNNQMRMAANLRLENSDDYRNVKKLFTLKAGA